MRHLSGLRNDPVRARNDQVHLLSGANVGQSSDTKAMARRLVWSDQPPRRNVESLSVRAKRNDD